MKRKLLALMCACLLGSVVFISACEDDEEEEFACEVDDDCFDDELCVQEICLETCDSDADCSGDAECVERPDGEGDDMVCVAAESCEDDEDCGDGESCIDGVCEATCTDDEDCATDFECVEDGDVGFCEEIAPGGACTEDEDCRSDELCDTGEETCVDIDDFVAPHYTVLIEDFTDDENPDMCGFDPSDNATSSAGSYEDDASGASLLWVALVNDATGDVEAYGHSVGFDPNNDTGYNDDLAVINGDEPYYGRQCPEWTHEIYDEHGMSYTLFRQDTVFTLGCGGWLLVQFEDSEGNLIAIDESHSVEVGLYTPECGGEYYRYNKYGALVDEENNVWENYDHCQGPPTDDNGYCPIPDHEFYEVSVCESDSVDEGDFAEKCFFITPEPVSDTLATQVLFPEDEEEEEDDE